MSGTGDEWVDTSLPGSGSDFDQATADGLYLSKLNDDTLLVRLLLKS